MYICWPSPAPAYRCSYADAGASRRLKCQRVGAPAFLPYAGMVVPAFAARTLEGDTVTIGDPSAGTRQILSSSPPRAIYCRQTLPAWGQIAETLGALSDG